MHRLITIALIALVALLGPSSSAFGGTQSGIDEYVEHVPGGGKDKPSDEFGKGGGKPLPKSTRDELTSQGADGESAAALAESGTPSAGSGSGESGAGSAQGPAGAGRGDGGSGNRGPGSGSAGDGAPSAADEDDEDDSWPGNLISGVFGSGSGGLGVGLPIGLALAALVAGLALVARRRRASPS